MTTMGKILVILNLVAALAIGGFLVVVFATRTNWKQGYDQLKVELDASRNNTKTLKAEEDGRKAKVKQVTAQQDTRMISAQAEKAQLEIMVEQQKKQLNTQQDLAKQAILNHEKSLVEQKRILAEVQLLAGIVEKREKAVLEMQQEVARYRNEALAADNAAKSAIARSQNLLDQLRTKEKLIADLQAGPSKTATAANVRSKDYDNPPSVYVKGRIEKVDAIDRGLVKVTIGSDAGISIDNTLEVYRLSPRPEYLGRLRIVETEAHGAIGRLIAQPGVTRGALQVGDEVASKLQVRP